MSTSTHSNLAVTSDKLGSTEKEFPVKDYFSTGLLTEHSPTKAKRITKYISIPCIVLFIAALLGVGQANALILTSEFATKVTITKQYNVVSVNGCAYYFSYEQKMIINGQTMMVLTTNLYSPGRYDLTLEAECDGNYIYGVGTCFCKIIDWKKITIGKETANLLTEIRELEPLQLATVFTPTNFLWIRKANKKNQDCTMV